MDIAEGKEREVLLKMREVQMIKVTKEKLNSAIIAKIYDEVKKDVAGAVLIFVGTVRNRTKGKTVLLIEYECYEKMAAAQLQKIADEAKHRWKLQALRIVHRYGELEPGEISVIIALSCVHRKEAYEASKFIIDTVKQSVPIWKREKFDDGTVEFGKSEYYETVAQ